MSTCGFRVERRGACPAVSRINPSPYVVASVSGPPWFRADAVGVCYTNTQTQDTVNRIVAYLFLAGLLTAGPGIVSCNKDEVFVADEPAGDDVPTGEPDGPQEPFASPYVARVLEYRPAPGQFVNTMPAATEEDTPETMNAKVLAILRGERNGLVTLGAFGGYLVAAFDHTVENRPGLCDLRVRGNAFRTPSNPDPAAPAGGSSEPGVIEVALDRNGNGLPDEEEWYEIAGSAHRDPAAEAWYGRAEAAGNDLRTLRDYRVVYERTATDSVIRWTDSEGDSGALPRVSDHPQSYWPVWLGDGTELLFAGTRLPQNAVLEQVGGASLYVLYEFFYGYADNAPNGSDASAIDLDWAVDESGEPVALEGADFIRIHTGVLQSSDALGESSTELMSIEDLHLLGEEIVPLS